MASRAQKNFPSPVTCGAATGENDPGTIEIIILGKDYGAQN